MNSKNKLDDYKSKRDLDSSPEPSGDSKVSDSDPVFVLQKHKASTLHYDFRIEIDGVLKSWAVPKGPSTDPSDKRLAIPTEDHPIEYADFEGVIPDNEYGAGPVMVWDKGNYENLNHDDDDNEISMDKAYEDGHIKFWLNGKKLKGGYALTIAGSDSRWLLVKMDDDEADARRNPVSTEPDSVLSSRSIEEIEKEENESGS